SSFEDLKEGKFGILEPKTRNAHAKSKPPKPKTQNTEPSEPDIILVPGVAFGLCMHRLGYGKGYYDKHLAKSRAYRIGICFDFQVMESLPKHEDDQRMDEILTDKRAIPM
ncbi:MAG: 5-formyltetrahydrofolate cyclo-ligase, partial [Candidatus Micrarchaeota archaeon]